MIKVNLLPDLVLNRQREEKFKKIATASIVGWLILVAGLAVLAGVYLGVQKVRLTSAKNSYTTLNAQVNSPDNVAFRKEALAVQASLQELNGLFSNQHKFSAIFKRVTDLLPKGVTLQSLNVDGEKVVIAGTAGSYNEVGTAIAALKQSSPTPDPSTTSVANAGGQIYFNSVAFSGASVQGTRVAFSLSATYVYPTGGLAK